MCTYLYFSEKQLQKAGFRLTQCERKYIQDRKGPFHRSLSQHIVQHEQVKVKWLEARCVDPETNAPIHGIVVDGTPELCWLHESALEVLPSSVADMFRRASSAYMGTLPKLTQDSLLALT